jgi:hypothetical protein
MFCAYFFNALANCKCKKLLGIGSIQITVYFQSHHPQKRIVAFTGLMGATCLKRNGSKRN